MNASAHPPQPIAPHPHLVQNYGRQDLRFVRGYGVWLEDDQGHKHLDALSGIAVNALGHAHPRLTAAIAEQAGILLHTSNLFHIPPQEKLAELLCGNSFADRAYFCNSGAEANESALKLARLWGNVVHEGRKPRLIAAQASFHGRSTGALALTGNPAYHAGFEPLIAVDFVPYGDASALEAAIGDDVAAVFLEPMQGEGGVRVPAADYLSAARALCDQHQTLLVLDEVQTGCGRTGKLWCHEHVGVAPDVMTLAKGLGGGVPIGAMLTTQSLSELLKPGTHASTFGGNHLACAAGVVVLEELLAPGFLEAVSARGEQLRAGLGKLFPGQEVRGLGLLNGVQMPDAPAPLMKACQAQGLILGTAGGNTLRIAPPLVITTDEVDELLRRLAAAKASL